MNNKVTFQLWNKPITLCGKFVRTTNINTIYKNDSSLQDTMINILIKEISSFEQYCRDLRIHSKIYDSMKKCVVTILNDKTVRQCLYRILLFFSCCYEDDTRQLPRKADVFYQTHMTDIERFICIHCFYSIRDTFLIDNTIIVIPEYYDRYGLFIKSKNFQQIIDSHIEKLHIMNNNRSEQKKKLKCFLIGINYILKDTHVEYKSLPIRLYSYKETNYFSKRNNNPKQGSFTSLRFL